MSTENQILRCPYCGGEFDHSLNQGGIEKHTCKNCGYVFYAENETSKEKLFALNAFRNEVINLLHAKIEGGKAERIANWKKHEETLEDYIEKCGGESNQDPLFAIARAAHITDGFERYTSKESKTIAETLYKVADDYARSNDKAINIKTLLSLYNQKLRNNTRNLVKGILFGVLGALLCGVIVGFVILNQYAPVLTDPDTGITVFIPNKAVPMFQKTGVELYVEKQPYNSGAYIDAKDALRNETEKFELYDISLINGQDPLAFDGTVTVEIPIPDGYLLSALKVYHVLSDEEFEEIPSNVSVTKNTISFKASHFSYYAVAEKHPIVVFDTDGAGEIDRQIVQRDTLAQKPADPQKEGYTFVGWMFGNELWDFADNTVTKDMVLKAKWEPIEYTITLVADGVALPTQTLKIAYKDTYASLPTNVSKAGYKFVGWYTAPENGLQITNDMVMQTAADHTLYAIFAESATTVSFNANGGTGNMPTDFEIEVGGFATLPTNTFTRNGYTFVGWATTENGTALYTDGAIYVNNESTSETINLYAVWEICTFTILFETNGGSEIPDRSYTVEDAFTFLNPTKTGYTFAGWYEDTEFHGEAVNQLRKGSFGNKTYYAKWVVDSYSIVFNSNGGTTINSQSYNIETAVPSLPAPTKTGYIFAGWYQNSNFSGKAITAIAVGTHGNITLYAKWEAIVAISASIKTPATKLSYYAGDTLTATGLTVEIRYNDNTVKTVSSSKLSISSVNMTQTGTKTVTASYEGVSVSYTVEVKALTVSLSVSTSTASSGYVTFTASVPAGTVSWKSSDTSVVTINANGVATFKNSVGVATITATVTNGTCTATATKKITLSNTSGTRYGQTSTQTSSTVLYGTRPTGYKTELPVLISIPTYSTNSADITDSNISTSTGMVSTSFVKNGVEGYVYYQFNYSSSSGGDNVNKIIHYTDDWRYNYGNSMSDNFRYYTSYGRQFYSTTNYPEHEANSNWTKYYAIWWAYQDKQAGHTWYVASGIKGALAASWYRFPIYNYTKTVTTYTYWYYTIN